MKGERRGITCSKGPQVGIEPVATVAKTEPLYMGHMLYQVSYPGGPERLHFKPEAWGLKDIYQT